MNPRTSSSIQSEREQEPESDKCNREEIKSAKLDKDWNLLHDMLVELAGELYRLASLKTILTKQDLIHSCAW